MGFDTLYDNASVRRRDRLLSAEEAAGVLRRGEYGFLAMQDAGDGAYGVPISYVWDGGSCIYLHCAPEGRKLRCLELGAHPAGAAAASRSSGERVDALVDLVDLLDQLCIRVEAGIAVIESVDV